ncbi:MAG: MBL fold metallo-hydrolase [Gammaproteobacteria bacterium]|nr:MBL fold metallo-hydrolase [Gammaproteobacteria bacterium]
MKRLHRTDLYGWSSFDETRNIDFHSVLWVRPGGSGGNVAIDPLPMSTHDKAHLEALGGLAYIVITNSDHVRDAKALASDTGAQVLGPAQEAADFPIGCDRWLSDGDQVVEGLQILELSGSKTRGELALVLEGTTLITGDLVRAHQAGALCLLPDDKLKDKAKAVESVRRMAAIADLESLLPGDGWPVFRDAKVVLDELLSTLDR